MDKTRRKLFIGGTCAALGLVVADYANAEPGAAMDVFTALKTRRSVRDFTSQPVTEKEIRMMLEAAMLAPSAMNEQPWEFVVIQDRSTLDRIAEGKNAETLAKAPLAILVCVNEAKVKIRGLGVIDAAMCSENILLCAHGLGLGAVFTSVYPVEKRMAICTEVLGLPSDIIPFGLIIIGRPKSLEFKTANDRINEKAIHREKW